MNPPRNRKGGNGNPPPKGARAPDLSRPVKKKISLDQIESKQVLMRRYVEKRKREIKEKQMRCGRTEAEVSYTTINRELALMRVMFNVLIKAGKAQKNPVRLVTLFQEEEKERIPTDREEERLFQAIVQIDKRGGHLKDVVTIGLHTGMRRGGILGLHKEWINLKDSVIIVPREVIREGTLKPHNPRKLLRAPVAQVDRARDS